MHGPRVGARGDKALGPGVTDECVIPAPAVIPDSIRDLSGRKASNSSLRTTARCLWQTTVLTKQR